MEEKLEHIPTVKPEAHFDINDYSQKILNDEPLSESELQSLESIYEVLQDLEKEVVTVFDGYRSSGVITRTEFLLVVDYFLVAHQQGPNSEGIKKLFVQPQNVPTEVAEELFAAVSIPLNTKELLQNIYAKITP